MPFIARALLCSLLATACAGRSVVRDSPQELADVPAAPTTGRHIAALALAQLGAPYQFAGATPRGFDCSGLVFYVHGLAGITVPRTAAGQRIAASEVSLDSLQPGDLVFYRSNGAGIDHVVIFIGAGEFVHAPRSGRRVELGRLDDPWYLQHLAGAGRLSGRP